MVKKSVCIVLSFKELKAHFLSAKIIGLSVSHGSFYVLGLESMCFTVISVNVESTVDIVLAKREERVSVYVL